jgi:glutamate-1-semialdehyde aminotransferase
MSNGFPLAAIVGRKELMKDCQYISGTFGGEAVSLAAADATIGVYRNTGCIPKMHGVGMYLQRTVKRILQSGIWLDGPPWKPRLNCRDEQRLHTIVHGLAVRGHLIHPKGFYISCAHTNADVDSFVTALTAAQLDDPVTVVQPKGVSWLRS